MDVKISRITYPKSVLTLYLKLFCKRRNSAKNKMLEGIQSWLTLSKSEKQKFFNKYKECRLNHKVKLADYLTKVQPYLKKRDITRTQANTRRNVETKLETTEIFYNDSTEHISHLDSTEYFDDVRNQDEKNEISIDNAEPVLNSSKQNESTNLTRKEQSMPLLVEPAPPSVRTARELFEMLKATSVDMNNESWASLSNVQKNRYQRAVQLLKNDYIRKYKAYLESLPSKELFNCYNNFFE